MTETQSRPAFRVLGTTNDVTTCEHCGRNELKGTIILAALDADGNEEGVTYFGATCGARAAGWTTKDIRTKATAANRERQEAERIARQAAHDADYAASVLLRGTADCPLVPRACREMVSGCVAHP